LGRWRVSWAKVLDVIKTLSVVVIFETTSPLGSLDRAQPVTRQLLCPVGLAVLTPNTSY
jgi:hypothetical protein